MKKLSYTVFLLILSMVVMATNDTIYVNVNASGHNYGTSWADAYFSLQTALDNAATGDQIWVACGTYKPSSSYDIPAPTDRHKHFRMIDSVAIYGGFDGTESAISQRTDFGMGGAHETILSGDIGAVGDSTDNCYHIFYHPSGLILDSAGLDGFTITGGNADSTDLPHNSGGGIMNEGINSPAITNVTFLSNFAVTGGAMYNITASSPTITNAIFLSNMSDSLGGGIYNHGSSPTIINATFSCNLADDGGGGLYNYNSSPILNNCIVWGNTAPAGRQLYIDGGTTTINYSCYANGTGDVTVSSGTFTATNNNISTNPKFVDSEDDFSIFGNSPCVNTGNNGYNSTGTDIRGETRIQNTTIDMGAYEWTSGTDPDVRIFYVDSSASSPHNGKSWTTAFNSFQLGLNAADSSDQVWVAAGTYKPDTAYDLTNSSRYYHFRMIEGVGIYGGFAGTEDSISQRTDFGMGDANETILCGDIGTLGTNSDNCYRVFYHPSDLNLTGAALLDGFTISLGYADGGDSYIGRGGGMCNRGHSSPSITNTVFLDNYALYNGGGLHNNDYSDPTLTNVTFKGNSAEQGGGMYNSYSAAPIITNAIFVLNDADRGGGMYNNTTSSPTVNNATFSLNYASDDGGGMYSKEGATPILNNCIIWGNTADDAGKQFYTSSPATLTLNYSCYANATNDIHGESPTTSNCISTNPKYINPAGDVRIHGNSPCVNAGNNGCNSETYDIRGEARIQDGTIDMGAYEWTSGIDPASDTVYVASIASGNNNGTTWANAFTSFQSALDLAASGDQVWVAKGTYKPNYAYDLTNTPRYYHFRMIEGVEIYGGFFGYESAVSQRGYFRPGESHETILSGDIGTPDDSTDNCYHIFYHPSGMNLTGAAIMDGFTITDANANGSEPHNRGGGMYNVNSSPTITNTAFLSNSVNLHGGGMYNQSSSPVITNASFLSNFAASVGGGIYNFFSSPIITNAIFSSNSADNGGGMFNQSSSPTITNATFTLNSSVYHGGCMYNYSSSSPILNNCIVWGNTAPDGKQFYLNNANTTLNNSCYANGTDDVTVSSGTFTATNNNITVDPNFIDAAGGDLRVFGNSPCLDAGLNSDNTETYDIRGEARIQNGTIDMGAYEWTSGTDPYGIYYVKHDAAGSNDGKSWTDAFTSFQSALDISVTGDQVWVAAGTYKPDTAWDLTNSPRYYHFRMIEGAAIYGGFDGTETAISQRTDFGVGGTHESILSGDIGIVGDSTDNCYHVFYHHDIPRLTNAAILDGFTITGGCADGSYLAYYVGGGMHNYYASPTISNVAFLSNSAVCGGGMYNYRSSPIIGNTVFSSNSAINGGGMYNHLYSSPVVTNATFPSNSASSSGGGMYNTVFSSPTITNALFSSNSAGQSGGGMYNASSTVSPTINNVTFVSNYASVAGGGIYTYSSSLTINNGIVWGNTATSSGNQIFINTGSTIMNYSCYANSTGDVAGNGTLTATNHNITANPKYIDPAVDFRIHGNSPCVNTGNNSYNNETYDIRGEARIQNTTIDMGAYEWTSGMEPATDTVYVSDGVDGNGTNWVDALASFQSALDLAAEGDQVWVAAGTYKPSSAYDLPNTSRYYHFRMIEGVEIYGGFAGTEDSVSKRTDFGFGEINQTILSGDITGDNCYHVFYLPNGLNLTSTARLDGFTITAGNANGSDPHDRGGGMYSVNSAPVITNVTFQANSAGNYGGAMHTKGMAPTISHVSFLSNHAGLNGGGMDNNTTSSQTITDVEFQFNWAGEYGGGMHNYKSSPTITNVTFQSNYCFERGGGLSNYNNSSPTMTNVTFRENSATIDGGGMYNKDHSYPTITNAVFLSNSSNYGGGLYSYDYSHPVVTNATFSKNNAGIRGGGIYIWQHASATFNNCIIWGNTTTPGINGQQICVDGNNAFMNYSCISDTPEDVYIMNGAFTATETITANPKFVDPEDDFKIFGNSPCVNTGNNGFTSETYDIRGEARIQDGTIDMGAYEWTSGIDPDVRIFYVDSSASSPNNGKSWTTAFTSFQSGLNAADSSDQVWVAKGTYKPDTAYDLTNTSRFYHFRMIESVEIYGGFTGTEVSISQRTDFGMGDANETILSGDIDGAGNDDCYHVFYHPAGLNLTNAALIDGFTITGGNANGSTGHQPLGGGMHNNSSSPGITNVSFLSNNAESSGGGMYNNSSSPSITNGLFWSNSALTLGGGMYNDNSSPLITNTTFSSNSAGVGGGGMSDINSNPTLNNCIIWGNTAITGKQVYISGGVDTINYSCFADGANDVTGTHVTDNCDADNPKFVNAAIGDLRLNGDSPCINTGLDSYNTKSIDIRGEARIQYDNIDKGAYEWTHGIDPAGAGVPVMEVVQVDTIANDDNLCFDATSTIYVTDTNVIQSGGYVRFVAGNRIVFGIGSYHVTGNGQIEAEITETGDYCTQPSSMLAVVPENNEYVEIPEQAAASKPYYKIYPNPTTGTFTLELEEYDQQMEVMVGIFSMMGEMVLQIRMTGEDRHIYDLSGQADGMYLIKILYNDKMSITKIIKQ